LAKAVAVAWKVSIVLATQLSTRFSSGWRRASQHLADAEYWKKHKKLKQAQLRTQLVLVTTEILFQAFLR
jgi:hypothetical protein